MHKPDKPLLSIDLTFQRGETRQQTVFQVVVRAVEDIRQADMMSVHLRLDGQVTTLSPALAHSRCSVKIGGVSAGQRHPSLHILPGRRVGYLAQSYPLAIGTFEPRLQSSHCGEILQNYGCHFASQVNNLK